MEGSHPAGNPGHLIGARCWGRGPGLGQVRSRRRRESVGDSPGATRRGDGRGRIVTAEDTARRDEGEQTQAASYAIGGTEWPVGDDEWEARAREALDQPSFDYIAGGAGSELTMKANREAFYRRRLVPKMLRGTAERDLGVEVLGARSPHPFMLAPIGVQGIAHPEAELATARAAAATRTPMIV